MGYLSALAMSESDLSLEEQLEWHFSHNCYPPVPLSMVEVAVQALNAVLSGEPRTEIGLPEGITFKDMSALPAFVLVEQLHLEAWLVSAWNATDEVDDNEIVCDMCGERTHDDESELFTVITLKEVTTERRCHECDPPDYE